MTHRVEADEAAACLRAADWEASDPAQADLILVNTCTVTGEADKKTRKAVRRAVGANPDARVLVTGCASALAPEAFLRMDERVRVVPKAGLIEAIGETAGRCSDAGHSSVAA